LELGKNRRRAEELPSPAVPEKEADGAGFSLNLPQPRAGDRIGDEWDRSGEDRDGSETAVTPALSIL